MPCWVHSSPRLIFFSLHIILFGVLSAGLTGCGSDDDGGAEKTLSWTAVPESTVLGYKVYWGTSSQHYESQADAGPNSTYTVTGLQPGTTYYFAVSAYNGGGESGLSDEVSSFVEVRRVRVGEENAGN